MEKKWKIRITDPRGRARTEPITQFPVVVGRDESLVFKIDDAQASRKHCQIEPDGADNLRVTDLKSTNGTYVNGKKITRVAISDRDRLKIGETVLEFLAESEVSVDEDTGAKRLSILKSFSTGKKPGGSPVLEKMDDKASILSRLVSTGGKSVMSNQRQALIADCARILAEMKDRDEILKTILTGLIEVYPIDRAAILLAEEEGSGVLKPCLSRSRGDVTGNLIVSRTICAHVHATGEAVITEDAVADPRFSSGDSIIEHAIGAVVAAPLVARDRQLGVLYASTKERAAKFSDDDLSYLMSIGNMVALTVLLDKLSL